MAEPRPDNQISALHAKWAMEALQSGPMRPLIMKDMDAVFARVVSRTRRRWKAGKPNQNPTNAESENKQYMTL